VLPLAPTGIETLGVDIGIFQHATKQHSFTQVMSGFPRITWNIVLIRQLLTQSAVRLKFPDEKSILPGDVAFYQNSLVTCYCVY